MNNYVLIIGGAGALGTALIPKFRAQGLTPLVADLVPSNEDVKSYSVRADDPNSLQAFLQELEGEGIQLSHIINTVGALRESGLTDIFQTSVEEIADTMQTNMLSQLLPVRFLGEHLIRGEGDKSFVMISSINAHHAYSIPFYSAAKAGLSGFLKPVAMDLGASGVRINIVTPGSVETPETLRQPKSFKDRARNAALKRLCTVGEVADAIMACINLTGMTGQEIVVDAGQSINPASSLYQQKGRGLIPGARPGS